MKFYIFKIKLLEIKKIKIIKIIKCNSIKKKIWKKKLDIKFEIKI